MFNKVISYSQNGEDVLLNRVFNSVKSGFYIDVGANHPVKDSVTKYFYDKGWRGINIEPGAEMFGLLSKARPRDINLRCAVSNFEGTAQLFSIDRHSGLSSLNELKADNLPQGERQSQEVKVIPLSKIFEEYAPDQVEFLKVDVEGAEKSVLESGDFKRFRPKVVVVEATKPMTQIPTHQEWEGILTSAGYVFACFDGYNRYYLREENKDLISLLSKPLQPDEFIHYRKAKWARVVRKICAFIDKGAS